MLQNNLKIQSKRVKNTQYPKIQNSLVLRFGQYLAKTKTRYSFALIVDCLRSDENMIFLMINKIEWDHLLENLMKD